MSDESVEDKVQRAAKLSPQEAKWTLLKLIDPTMTDNKAASLCDYAKKSGTQVKNRVAGKIGGILEDYGIGLEAIAENLKRCFNATKTKAVFLPKYENGKQVDMVCEVKDLGPDYGAINAANKTLIMLQKIGEQEMPGGEPTALLGMDREGLEATVGRGGPIEFIDVEFDVGEEDDVSTG